MKTLNMNTLFKQGFLYGFPFMVTVVIFVLFLIMAGTFSQNAHAGTAYDVVTSASTTGGTWSGGNPDIFTPNGPGATISVLDITSRLSGTSVTIMTAGTGTAGDIIINLTDAISWSGNTTLTLSAHRNISINAIISATSSTAGLVLIPDSDGDGDGAVSVNGTAVITLAASPAVTKTTPANSASNVAVNAPITAIFSESMLSSTITSSNFSLSSGLGAVTGLVSYNSTTLTATFTPSGNLAYSTIYTATITNLVTDNTGSALVSNYTWTFTTQAVPDVTPPVTTATSAGGLYNTTQYVTLSCTDSESGCQTTSYCLGAGCTSWTVYSSGTITISTSTDLRFYSVDFANNQENINTIPFTIDMSPPILTLSMLPDGSSTNFPVLNVSGIVSDDTGIQSVTVNGVATKLYDSQPVVRVSQAVLMDSGQNIVTIVVTDDAGNQTSATRAVTYDPAVPALAISEPSDVCIVTNPTLTVTGTAPTTASVLVSVNSGTATAATLTGGGFSMPVFLAPGWNTVLIEATDGGKTKTVKRTVMYSNTLPALAATQPPQDIRTIQNSATISGAADPAATVDILWGGVSYPQTVSGGMFTTQSLVFDAMGAYPVVIRATIGASTSSIVRSIVYDIKQSVFAVNPVSTPTNQPSQTISGTMVPGSTITASCATASVGTFQQTGMTTWQVQITGMTEGQNDVTILQMSGAYQTGSAFVSIMLDTKAPSVFASIKSGYYGAAQVVSLASDEPTATIYYTTDGSDPTTSPSKAAYSSALNISLDTTLMFYAVDLAGNAGAVSTESYIIDETAIVISQTAPGVKSILTTPAVSYTLSETAMEGVITFTWSGGAPDSASPQVYTLLVSELTPGSHSLATGLTLKEGAFYTVTFEAKDLAGNKALPVKNNMVFFDSNYGQGPAGNVDNTGSSVNRVDNADVEKLLGVMNSRPGDALWNPSCDLNKDNVIDQKDELLLQMHYGEQS